MSGHPDPQGTPVEAAVRLRAHPPSPKRLSRKVLMAGTGAIGLVIAFALVTGLSPRSEAASPRSETAPPAAAALPEGLSRLPARYEAGVLAQASMQAETHPRGLHARQIKRAFPDALTHAQDAHAAASLAGGIDGWLSRRSSNFRRNLKRAHLRAQSEGMVFERAQPSSLAEADRLYEADARR
jgi:hypothetical protein